MYSGDDEMLPNTKRHYRLGLSSSVAVYIMFCLGAIPRANLDGVLVIPTSITACRMPATPHSLSPRFSACSPGRPQDGDTAPAQASSLPPSLRPSPLRDLHAPPRSLQPGSRTPTGDEDDGDGSDDVGRRGI